MISIMLLVALMLVDTNPIAGLTFNHILASGVFGWIDDVVVVFRQIVPTVNDKELSVQQNVCSNSKNVESHVLLFKKTLKNEKTYTHF